MENISIRNFIEDSEQLLALSRFQELDEYLSATEEYLVKTRDDFEARMDEQAKRVPSEQREEFNEWWNEQNFRYAEEFPRILRNSILVSVCSLLEYEMGVICRRLKKEYRIPTDWNDEPGNTLDQFKEYTRLAQLNVPYGKEPWRQINYYWKVRRHIVHRNGLLDEFRDQTDLVAYVRSKSIVSEVTIQEQIALTTEFCKEVSETMQGFLTGVYKSLLGST